jgi:hypothetical protein
MNFSFICKHKKMKKKKINYIFNVMNIILLNIYIYINELFEYTYIYINFMSLAIKLFF